MPNDKPKMYGKPKMDHGPKMYGKPKSAGLKALAAKNKNLTYTGPAMSGGGPKKVGSQERYNDSPFNYKAQVMMADMPMMYGAGKPKDASGDEDLTRAREERARREMVRQKQQDAIEERDKKRNAMRAENIRRRKNAAKKMGKEFNYADTVTPTVEGGELN